MTAKVQDAPGVGNVRFELDGEHIELKPTAQAVFTLQSLPGGLYGYGDQDNSVHRRVEKCDLMTMCAVIRAGLGVGPGTDKDLPDKIYTFGLFKMRDFLRTYLYQLGNSGVPIGADDPKGEGDEAGNG